MKPDLVLRCPHDPSCDCLREGLPLIGHGIVLSLSTVLMNIMQAPIEQVRVRGAIVFYRDPVRCMVLLRVREGDAFRVVHIGLQLVDSWRPTVVTRSMPLAEVDVASNEAMVWGHLQECVELCEEGVQSLTILVIGVEQEPSDLVDPESN
ncbi:MAG: hypothetical protein ABIH41_05650 [Nanoarchaeota archaeon]